MAFPRMVNWALTAGLVANLACPAGAADLPPGATTLRIEPFEGFCQVDPYNQLEADLIEFVQKVNFERNRVVDLQVDCPKLELFRSRDPSSDLLPNVTVLLRTEIDGRATSVNLSRAAYLDLVQADLASSAGQRLMSQNADDIEARMNEALKRVQGPAGDGIKLNGLEDIGLVGRDDDALYLALVERYENRARPVVYLTVSSITLLRGHVLIIRLQRNLSGPDLIDSMVNEISAMTRKLIALNDGET